MTPPIAVIILNWNGAKLLREFLPAVIANTNSNLGRIIVADNGSTDESRTVLCNEFPNVQTIFFDQNHGFAEGYNRAISQTECPYTILLNSDVAPEPGWLEPLYDFMQTHPEAAACQPKILSYREPERFEYAGGAGGFVDRNGFPYCRGRIFATCERDFGQYDTTLEVDWASGAALMVRTELYLRAGGLDPRFFAHMEEIDLCWRLRSMGWAIFCVPQSVVRHLGGGSLPPSDPRKTYLNFRNNLIMLHKNLPKRIARPTLLRRRLLDTIAWAKFVLTFKWKSAAAIFKAHRHFARDRRQYQSPSADTPVWLDRRPDIIAKYYLQRKRTFDSL